MLATGHSTTVIKLLLPSILEDFHLGSKEAGIYFLGGGPRLSLSLV